MYIQRATSDTNDHSRIKHADKYTEKSFGKWIRNCLYNVPYNHGINSTWYNFY